MQCVHSHSATIVMSHSHYNLCNAYNATTSPKTILLISDQIATIQGDSSWTSLNTTYPTYYRKVAGIVTVLFRLNGGSTPSSGDLLGTLPSGYRPSYQVVVATQNLHGHIVVDTDGKVNINANSGQTLNNFMGCCVSYPV